jgi:hypothetical protein
VSACFAQDADRAAISKRLAALQHISAQYTIETDMDFDPALAPLAASQQAQNHPGAPHLGSFDPKRQEIADQRFFFTPPSFEWKHQSLPRPPNIGPLAICPTSPTT